MSALLGSSVHTEITFTVFGKPRPQGSMRSFLNPLTQKVVSKSQIKGLMPWRQQMSATAHSLGAMIIAKHCSVAVTLDFYFERPASVSVKKRPGMTVAPDLDKLQRAVFDSLTGTILSDDAQIVDVQARKHYGIPERVEIRVREVQ